jgi:heme-degrading monooxygenase HmoA
MSEGLVVTVFRSRLRSDIGDYPGTMARMLELARSMPGFIDIKTFVADDGERASIIRFADPDSQGAWRDHPEHRQAQEAGRERYYPEYAIQVCEVISEHKFMAPSMNVESMTG